MRSLIRLKSQATSFDASLCNFFEHLDDVRGKRSCSFSSVSLRYIFSHNHVRVRLCNR